MPVEEYLEEAGLSSGLMDDPLRPVPLVLVAGLLVKAARQIVPDLPCQIVAEADDLELAVMGKVALGTNTARQALKSIIAALPYYCSHEHISLQEGSDRVVLKEFFAFRSDPETAHLLLQYAAAMIDRIIAMSGAPAPRFRPHRDSAAPRARSFPSQGLVRTRTGCDEVPDAVDLGRQCGVRSAFSLSRPQPGCKPGTPQGASVEGSRNPVGIRPACAERHDRLGTHGFNCTVGRSRRDEPAQSAACAAHRRNELLGELTSVRHAEGLKRLNDLQDFDRLHRVRSGLFRHVVAHPCIPQMDRKASERHPVPLAQI